MKRKLLSSLLAAFFFSQHMVQANTLVVTSNADSGPGTLRGAIVLANANGTIIPDTIIFNITDITRAGRTILLNTELPLLTSKMIIDGSSQTGTAFGQSDAKIIIEKTAAVTGPFKMLQAIDISDIEIYGIYFLFSWYYGPSFTGLSPTAFFFWHSQNITIGKPGKGNYFRGMKYGVYSEIVGLFNNNFSDTIIIQSNIFGNDENGKTSDIYLTISLMPIENALELRYCKNTLIGGPSIAEGNTIKTDNIELFTTANLQGQNNWHIINNKISVNTDGTYDGNIPTQQTEMVIDGWQSDIDLLIKKNIIHGAIRIQDINGPLKVQGNTIFFFDNPRNLPYKIIVYRGQPGSIIGGETTDEQNTIYGNDYSVPFYNYYNDYVHSIRNLYSNGLTIRKNKIYCNAYYGSSIIVEPNAFEVPYVRIAQTLANFVSGKATPGSRIEVFSDDECMACEGKIFLGETVAASDSSWSFTGVFSGTIVATATNMQNTTSGFSQPIILGNNVTTQNPSCNLANGFIHGLNVSGSTDNVEWHKVFVRNNITIDSIVGTTTDLENIGPGDYYFFAKLGTTCRSFFRKYTLIDITPRIDTSGISLQHPSCGQANGRILGFHVTGGNNNTITFQNDIGQSIPFTAFGGNYYGLLLVPAGSYKMFVNDTVTGCRDTTRFYLLINQSGPSLTTNNIQITPATCNNSNGSITNITTSNVTGTPFIQWTDSLNNIVGNTLDLLNQPAGKYKLKFKDQSGCDTITTPFYIIPATGRITIDTTGKIITKGGCTINNGSIRHIMVVGADTYQWQNLTTNTPAGNTIDIYNLPPGNYQLTATNAMGCTAISPVINVPQSVFIPIGVTSSQSRNAICGENNGILRIISFNNDSNYYTFRWIDSTTNQQIGTGTAIYTLAPGTTLLLATDSNGCEKQIYKITIGIVPKPVFDLSAMKITDDKCSRSAGSITGIKVTGLFGPATTYSWTDINNNVAGNSIDLLNVPAGQYYLTVIDGGLCTIQSPPFTIVNTNDPGIILQYDDQVIPRNTAATLRIKNFQPGTYFLYSDPGATQLIQQNTTGVFTTALLTADIDYYVKFVSGTCISSITHVKIKVVDKSFFAIATGFTPNNDGNNDRLTLKVIGFIDVQYFRIYNRNGEEVFFTKTINNGWDGRYRSIEQPSGVFVWMAKGKDINGKVITAKGTFVLIR
jgi:gliding motility-associated-like protein